MTKKILFYVLVVLVAVFIMLARKRFEPVSIEDRSFQTEETVLDTISNTIEVDDNDRALGDSILASIGSDSATVDVSFQTPDLRFFDLHGRVRSMIMKSDFSEKIVWFTREGKIDKYTSNGEKVKVTKRDANGYITRESSDNYFIDYTWGTDSLVAEFANSMKREGTYSYDTNEHLSVLSVGDQNTRYEYTSEDKYRNWTSRNVIVTGNTTVNCKEIRRIDYWR